MPWQGDPNTGRCSFHTCTSTGPRCAAFMCAVCCAIHHKVWAAHKLADGSVSPSSALPAHYGGADQKAGPVEYDYDNHPVEFGEVKELEDKERVYLPLSNYRARTEWPVDYIG